MTIVTLRGLFGPCSEEDDDMERHGFDEPKRTSVKKLQRIADEKSRPNKPKRPAKPQRQTSK